MWTQLGPPMSLCLLKSSNGNNSGQREKPQEESGTWDDPKAQEEGWALGELEGPCGSMLAGLTCTGI